jgi:hypothetical protein
MTDLSQPRPRNWGLTAIVFLLVVPALLVAVWTWAALHISYSSGERAGYIQKISQKGWLFKTWEGELAMATIPGVMPQIFDFSTRDNEVAHQLEQHIGQRVSIHYEQHRGIPGTAFGETQYFITSVTSVPDTAAPAAAPPGK